MWNSFCIFRGLHGELLPEGWRDGGMDGRKLKPMKYLFIHSVFFLKYLLDVRQYFKCQEYSINKPDKNPCPHGAYISGAI